MGTFFLFKLIPIEQHFNGQKQLSSLYITYTLLMQAQDALNEEPLDDGQAAEVLLIWTRMSYLIEQQ